MPRVGRLLERYVVAAIWPYFLLSLLLLTTALLAQQATRFAEILGGAGAPLEIAAEITLGLLPSVLVFTLPMAVLTGTATGFSRLGGDSELIAMRAAGVGSWRVVGPAVLFGVCVSVLTLHVGLKVAPEAARGLRQTALKAALKKLESPVEPRAFSTELPGKVIYVRDGDRETGQWGRVFMQWQDPAGPVRLVTARTGRIDSAGERAELVLGDAVVTTLPEGFGAGGAGQVTTERSTQLRVRDDRLNAGRGLLFKQLRERGLEPDELNWRELWARARGAGAAAGEEGRKEALFALHKRLALGTAPLAFAFFGAVVGLRVGRRGRGLGILLSLATMIVYYLLALAGEYASRVALLTEATGAWLPSLFALALGACLLASSGRRGARTFARGVRGGAKPARDDVEEGAGGGTRLVRRRKALLLGLLDRSILGSLAWAFATALSTLVAVFLIFTVFELLRFIAVSGAGGWLVARYLFFLLPLSVAALTPLSVLVAVLAAYALLSRRSEAVAWWACGQSTYRLALPGLLFASVIGLGLWTLQEAAMPGANRLQNSLRQQIRGGLARGVTAQGRRWLAASGQARLYSYEFEAGAGTLARPTIYEFDSEGVHLARLTGGAQGRWAQGGELIVHDAVEVELGGGTRGAGRLLRRPESIVRGAEPSDSFKPQLNNPAEMSAGQLSGYIKTLKSRGQSAPQLSALVVALERKRAEPFAPLVMTLLGVPLALAFGRRSALAALCAAVGVGTLFWGAMGGFQQLGNQGLLPAWVSVWSPLTIFAAAGLYLLFKAKT